eukprot:3516948-Pyramimonas_sp.AAC.1
MIWPRRLQEVAGPDSQQIVYPAVEHAASSVGRGPRVWPWHLGTQRQRQRIHAQCRYYLRGAASRDYAKLEEEDGGGNHVESYLGPWSARSVFELPRGHLCCQR